MPSPYPIHRIISGTSSAVIKPFKPMANPENISAKAIQ